MTVKTHIYFIFIFFFISCEEDPYPQDVLKGFKKFYGGIQEEYAYGLTSAFDGGVIIAGFSTTFTEK